MALELTRQFVKSLTLPDIAGVDANATAIVSATGASVTVLVDQIIICNTDGGSVNLTGFLIEDGEAPDDTNVLFRTIPVASHATLTYTFKGGLPISKLNEAIVLGASNPNSLRARALCREYIVQDGI